MIRFKFNQQKALEAIALLLSEANRPIEKVKLMKLLYLVDRDHFINHGVSVTGDRLCAMPWGPVPSSSLNMVNGTWVEPQKVFDIVHVDDNNISLRSSPGTESLSADEIATIKKIASEHGNKHRWMLVNETHKLPEYREHYEVGTSTWIPFESIAKHSQNSTRYRKNRPVIMPETAAAMTCPFPPESH